MNKNAVVAILVALGLSHVVAQGLVLNEVSNGTAGSKEFMEFVVDGTPCTNVDIRGWIIDDNNGDFSCGPCASAGIATGHLRFTNAAIWSAVPTGSIILIYNEVDVDAFLPLPDPTDANADGVYVIPSSNGNLEYSSTPCLNPNIPTALASCPGPCTGNAGYTGVCYTSGGNGWANLGLRNTGDAAQARTPAGAYYHGFAYGTPANNMSGGPDGLIDPIAGTNLSFFFDNSISNNYRDVNNWSSITAASATPGTANNANNGAWINSFDCPLPVQLSSFKLTCINRHLLELNWETESEVNNDFFSIQGSYNGFEYQDLLKVEGMGNYNALHSYETQFMNSWGYEYLRLIQVDFNGESKILKTVGINCNENISQFSCWFYNEQLYISIPDEFKGDNEIQLQNSQGQIMHKSIHHSSGEIAIPFNNDPRSGIYVLSIYNYDQQAYRYAKFFKP